MVLYKNSRNLKFPHLATFINAYCHNPIAVLRALKISMKHHIRYFYLPQANDKEETHRRLHTPKAEQWSIGEHKHICRTMNIPQHGQFGLDKRTWRRGGRSEEKAEVNWLEAIPLCRGVWKAMEGLQRSEEFDQISSNNQQGALSIPHRGLTLEGSHVCFQMVVTFIQHLFKSKFTQKLHYHDI